MQPDKEDDPKDVTLALLLGWYRHREGIWMRNATKEEISYKSYLKIGKVRYYAEYMYATFAKDAVAYDTK
jgi:hypothetical protein